MNFFVSISSYSIAIMQGENLFLSFYRMFGKIGMKDQNRKLDCKSNFIKLIISGTFNPDVPVCIRKLSIKVFVNKQSIKYIVKSRR